MKTRFTSLAFGAVVLSAASVFAQTPSIADPFSVYNLDTPLWATDRYQPQYFGPGNVGGQNTLSIQISSLQSIDNRTGGQNIRFYNTQGNQLTAGPVNFTGSTFTLSTTLYVSGSYLTNAQRTDVWVNSAPASAPGSQDLFSILGVSNVDTQAAGLTRYATGAQFQFFSQSGSFINLHSLTVADTNQWWTLTISLQNIDANTTRQTYTVTNGASSFTAFELVTAAGAADVIANTVFLQAYNFTGSAFAGGDAGSLTQNNYTADWARGIAVVPEPGSVLAGVFAIGLAGAAIRRRKQQA